MRSRTLVVDVSGHVNRADARVHFDVVKPGALPQRRQRRHVQVLRLVIVRRLRVVVDTSRIVAAINYNLHTTSTRLNSSDDQRCSASAL